MPEMIDIFSGDAFSALSLSTAFSQVPNQYGRINDLGLFKPVGINTTVAAVEIENGVLNLIPSTPRGTAAPKNVSGKRKLKYFGLPRIALDDAVFPDDVQNVRAFGSQSLETPEAVVNRKLIQIGRKHDITEEYLKAGAISGVIKDADGSTILDLFTEFGVTEEVVDFELDDEDTDVRAKCEQVSGFMEDNLLGETMSSVHALWAPDAWAAFTAHPSVKAAYQNYQGIQAGILNYGGLDANPLRNDLRKGFVFGGILHEEYRGKASYLNADGTTTTRKLIPDGTVRFLPMGTSETFINYYGPADWMDTVNTIGVPRYAYVEPKKQKTDILTQSNPLPICLRPKLLVKGTA